MKFLTSKYYIVCLLLFFCLLSLSSARITAATKDRSSELEELRMQLSINPRNPKVLNRFVSLCLILHLENEALAVVDNLQAISHDNYEAMDLYIKTLARNGKYYEALVVSDSTKPNSITSSDKHRIIEAIRISVEAEHYIALGSASEKKRDFEEAARLLQKAIQLDPENLSIRKTLGWILLDKTHEPTAAYLHLNKVIHDHPSDLEARKLFAWACTQTGRPKRAISEFQKVLVPPIDSKDLWMWTNFAKSLAFAGKWKKAEQIYDSILSVDPKYFYALLGKAELSAWRGKSKYTVEQLDKLIDEKPQNPDVRVLLANMYRWDWRLFEAYAEYRKVLELENNYDAINGLREVVRLRSCYVMVEPWNFTDTTEFSQSYIKAAVRLSLSDKAYLYGKSSKWKFRHPYYSDLCRTDYSLGMEYHWTRWLDTSVYFSGFDYENRDPFLGIEISAKLSPMSNFDVYATYLCNHPFISSISTVYSGMHQNSLGVGVDAKIYGNWSFHGGLEMKHISDGNHWWHFNPQVSYQLIEIPKSNIHLEYEVQSYTEKKGDYWTPSNRQLLVPKLDLSHSFAKFLPLNVTVKLPYVFECSDTGVEYIIGTEAKISRQLHAGIEYTHSSIPEDQGPWSGYGWKALVAWYF